MADAKPAKAASVADERFTISQPTVASVSARSAPLNIDSCGNCPGWKQHGGPRSSFGQCLPAIRFLGAPVYTPDSMPACSLDMETKAKGGNR